MDAFEYRFTSKTGDIYIVRILNDGARFLSSGKRPKTDLVI